MAEKKRTTKCPVPKMQRVTAPSTTLDSLFDVVFAPLPENVEAQIRSMIPAAAPIDEDNLLGVLQNFKPEGWTPFAELMWSLGNREQGESAAAASFTQSEVDKRISYLDEDFRA